MEGGFLLANILEHIDQKEFSSNDKSLNNWSNVKDRLENYLSTKGLGSQNLDFELADIRKGDVQAIISALLQILAILAAFNPSNWERILSGTDYMAKMTVTKFLDAMITDIKEEIDFARKSWKTNNFESAEDIKILLQRLEKHENTIDEQTKTIISVRADLEKETQERLKLGKILQEKDKEILEMQQIKNEALKLLESNYAHKRDDQPSKDLQKKVIKLNQEVDALNEKLLAYRSQIIDKENEIDKLKIIQAFLEEKKTELEETNEQLSYYKKMTDTLKKEKEIFETKLKCFEYADKNIVKLKTMLKEEKQASINLKLLIF